MFPHLPSEPSPRIVLVDDDGDLLKSLAFSFETEGFAICAFGSAEAAQAECGAGYACYIVDHQLPGMSGLDFLERLRQQGEHAPFVLITSNPSAAMEARARRAGVIIVEKPLLDDILNLKVRQLIGAV